MVATVRAAPTVTGHTPPDGATNVPITTTVTATFSEAMDPATVTAGSMLLSQFVGIRAIAAGNDYTVALRQDGTVVAWGWNVEGQSTVPAGLTGVTAIAAGSGHSVALKQDGTVIAWGDNDFGQSTVPAGLSGVTAIAAGTNHTVALKQDGTVVAWGYNATGQTMVPAGLTGVKAIAAGTNHTVALRQDGTVVVWGDNDYGESAVPAGLSGVTAISAGYLHTVALRQDGTVIAWGYNGSGATAVPAGLTGVKAIAAGGYHTLALKQDGTVVAWGSNYFGQSTVPVGLSGVTAIAAGSNHTVALRQDGAVVAWGANHYGESAVPAGLNGVTAIAAGGWHTVALRQDGTVYAWGMNYCDMPGITGVSAIAAGYHRTLALRQDGTVVGLCQDNNYAVPAGLSRVIALAVGEFHAVALRQDGTLVAWGNNDYGKSTVPAGLAGVKAIAASRDHTVALRQNGTVVAWGGNAEGQTTVPVGLSGVTAIAAGGGHTVALRQDGTVVAWGDNYWGQSKVPTGLSGVTAIAAGEAHTVALRQDGTVVSWGYNGSGATAVPAGLTGVKAIAASYYHTVALRQDGTVVAWGDNDYSQSTAPSPVSIYDNLVPVTVAYNSTTRTATLTPAALMDGGDLYHVTVSGARSEGGGILTTPITWSFSTSTNPVNGACGSSNGGTFTVLPTSNLCAAGKSSSITGTGPWSWTCQGGNGGANASCSANVATTYFPADLVGEWEVNSLASGAGAPWWERGKVIVAANGSFSGTLTESDGNLDPVSGTFSISPNGIVIIAGNATMQCIMDADKTVITCRDTWSEGDNQGTTSMIVLTRKAATYSQADLIGTWHINSLASGPAAPWWMRMTVTIDGNGHATGTVEDSEGTSEPVTFTMSMTADGIITCTSGCSDPQLRCTMDAGKTVAVCTNTWASGSPGTTELAIMTKRTNSYAQADLTGSWGFSYLSAGGANVWAEAVFDIKSDGSFSMTQNVSDGDTRTGEGKITISTDGLATIDIEPNLKLFMDAGKTIVAGVGTDSYEDNTAEVIVLTRLSTLPVTNGVCGSSNGQTFTTAPSTNLCSAGTASSVTGSGPWSWTCQGINGGTNASCTAFIASHTLSVTVDGTGQGTVTSAPQNNGAIACTGTGNGCTATFDHGTEIVLTATPSTSSFFPGWGNDCSGSSSSPPYSFILVADKSVTATFCTMQPFRIVGTSTAYFPTFLATYAAAQDGSTATIQAQAVGLTENLNLDRNVSLTLKGGYNSDFTAAGGYTSVHGVLTVKKGSLIVDSLIIR